MYEDIKPNLNFVEREKEIKDLWDKEEIFQKSIKAREEAKPYVFYDGPPTANGKPHIGHVLTRVIKDMIPRYRTMKGYNTDVLGFQKAIPSDFKIEGKCAGILGTGGAAHAAVVGLAEKGIKSVRFYTRNIPNSLDLLNYLRRMYPDIQFDAFQIEHIRDLSMLDILVNATPIGMLSHSADMTPVEKDVLSTLPKTALVYDIIYNPRKTILLKLAESLGYRTVNGVDMFIGQAIAAEEIWTGLTPNADAVKIAILENL